MESFVPVAATILAAHTPKVAASWLQDLIMSHPALSLSGVHALAGEIPNRRALLFLFI